MPDVAPAAVSISRYAAIWGLSRPTVYKYLQLGLIQLAWRQGRVVRVRNQATMRGANASSASASSA